MKNANRIYLIWGIRIVVSILFILSAVAKLYPSPLMGISSFETKYLGAIGIEGDLSKVISRLLIGFEFTLGIFLLLPFYLKKIVIPTTIVLLGAFSLHLSFQVFQGDASNCGCFGELIPMTPLEALIKNILSIGLLMLLVSVFKEEIQEKRNIHPVLYTGFSIALLMFVFLPQGSNNISVATIQSGTSIYSQYFPDASKGNRLVCFFSPTCDHCKETGKEIVRLKKQFPGLIPEVNIVFMDESYPIDGSPILVKEFFEFIGQEFSHVAIEPAAFWDLFQSDVKGMEVPGVFYLQEGIHKARFAGSAEYQAKNPFSADALLEIIKKEN